MIQVVSAMLMNAHFVGFSQGRIYQGSLKRLCVPALNCYSCPGALGACPIGSLQALSGNPQTLVSFYVYGFLLIVGLLFSRAVCGFLCPFGFIQELLNKIPFENWCVDKRFSDLKYLKFFVLVTMVVGIPTLLTQSEEISFPIFCEFICPAGTLEAGVLLALANSGIRENLGWLFAWKAAVLAALMLLSTKVYRPFCRFLCPLGAVYSLFNRISVLHIKVDNEKCVGCEVCHAKCPMEAKSPDSTECIRCGTCVRLCPQRALGWSVARA